MLLIIFKIIIFIIIINTIITIMFYNKFFYQAFKKNSFILPFVSCVCAPVAPGVTWFGAWWLAPSAWSGLAPGLAFEPGGQRGETVGRGIGRVGGIVVRIKPENFSAIYKNDNNKFLQIEPDRWIFSIRCILLKK